MSSRKSGDSSRSYDTASQVGNPRIADDAPGVYVGFWSVCVEIGNSDSEIECCNDSQFTDSSFMSHSANLLR